MNRVPLINVIRSMIRRGSTNVGGTGAGQIGGGYDHAASLKACWHKRMPSTLSMTANCKANAALLVRRQTVMTKCKSETSEALGTPVITCNR
jgi:hypothetical protein